MTNQPEIQGDRGICLPISKTHGIILWRLSVPTTSQVFCSPSMSNLFNFGAAAFSTSTFHLSQTGMGWKCSGWLTECNFPLLGIPYLGWQAGPNIATEIATPFFNSGRNVNCENYCIDMALADTFLKNGWMMVGTVRGNKLFLTESFKLGRQLPLHDSEFAHNENATVLKYQSKRRKNIILLSSMHDTGIVGPYQNPKKKTEVVLIYNSTKGVVDTLDKMAHDYTVKCKTQCWPLVMFFNIIDLATIAPQSNWTIHFQSSLFQKTKKKKKKRDDCSTFIQSICERTSAQIKHRMTEVVILRSLLDHKWANKMRKETEQNKQFVFCLLAAFGAVLGRWSQLGHHQFRLGDVVALEQNVKYFISWKVLNILFFNRNFLGWPSSVI